jgi:hypothetical protein
MTEKNPASLGKPASEASANGTGTSPLLGAKEASHSTSTGSHTPIKGRWDRVPDWREEPLESRRSEAGVAPEEPLAASQATPPTPSEPIASRPAGVNSEGGEGPLSRSAPPAGQTLPGRSPLAEELQQAAISLTMLAMAIDALDGLLHRSGRDLQSVLGGASPWTDALNQLAQAGERNRPNLDLGEWLRQYLLR